MKKRQGNNSVKMVEMMKVQDNIKYYQVLNQLQLRENKENINKLHP